MSLTPAPKCYLILSLDGGGVRGVLQARLLERLEESMPFLHKVDLIAGSSIGGINALGLAAGISPTEMVEFYQRHTEDIFSKRDWWDSIAGPSDEVFRADYDNSDLQDVLEDYFGKKKLSDLEKKVVITSFDLDNHDEQTMGSTPITHQRRFWKAKIFHNYESPGNDGDQSVVDIGLRTSAAPTYFPSHQGYIDGGLVANNPSLCALGRAVKSGVRQDQIVILSVSAGFNATFIEGDRLDWGYKQWASYLFPMLMDGMVGIPDYVCDQLLPKRYARVHPFLPEDVALDDADRVDDLIEWANDVDLSKAIELLANLPG